MAYDPDHEEPKQHRRMINVRKHAPRPVQSRWRMAAPVMSALLWAASPVAVHAADPEPAPQKPRSLAESCIPLSLVLRTEILDDQTVLFHMRNGRIKKATLSFRCPSLKFYGSFSYEVYSNRLCARVDTIVSRAGTHCPIGDIMDVTPPPAPPATAPSANIPAQEPPKSEPAKPDPAKSVPGKP